MAKIVGKQDLQKVLARAGMRVSQPTSAEQRAALGRYYLRCLKTGAVLRADVSIPALRAEFM